MNMARMIAVTVKVLGSAISAASRNRVSSTHIFSLSTDSRSVLVTLGNNARLSGRQKPENGWWSLSNISLNSIKHRAKRTISTMYRVAVLGLPLPIIEMFVVEWEMTMSRSATDIHTR